MGMESLLYPGGPPPPRPRGVMYGPPNPRLAGFADAIPQIGGPIGLMTDPIKQWAHKTGYGQETSYLENLDAGSTLLDATPIGAAKMAAVKYAPLLAAMTMPKAKGLLDNVLPMDEASRMARAKEMGFDVDNPVYHGSTHNVESFDASIASPESDWGRGVYASSSIDDINANYAGVGPDLTGRISSEAERVADELMDMPKGERKGLLSEHGIKHKEYSSDEAGVAEKIASNRLVGGAGEGVVYPLSVNKEKYATVGGSDSTVLEGPDYYAMAKDDIDLADYPGYDLDDAINERMYEIQADDPDGLYGRVASALEDTDAYPDEAARNAVMEEIQDHLIDGELDLDYLDDAIRNNITEAYDEATGELTSSGGVAAQVFKNLGFDGVIDNRVNLKFGGGRKYGQSMEGVDAGTQHIITFPGAEHNIRSKFAAFDPSKAKSAGLLAGAAGGAISLPLLMEQFKEQERQGLI